MRASPLAYRLRKHAAVADWQWWRLPLLLRWYVAAVPVVALAVIALSAVRAEWRLPDLVKFLLLMCCGIISVVSTPRIMYAFPGLTRDFSTVWVVPTAILLPPVYAALVPIPFVAALHLCVHRGVLHRMVFTAAATSLSYAAASMVFRWFPHSFAGGTVGAGFHAFTWCIAVAACEILGGRAHHFLILGAVKLSNPKMRIWALEWDREAMQALFVEIDLGVLITLAVGLSPALVLLALPTVLLVRRFLVFPVLEAQSRIDAKTGLLNVSTWERETENEIARSRRTQSPLSLALVDIDHFKVVNDTHGHLVGDRVLRAVAEALTGHLRSYDKAGRFGGEEFVLLLTDTSEDDACRVAERLRSHIARMVTPVDDAPEAPGVQVTISIGVSAMEPGMHRDLTDLLAAADSALYRAKQTGRNRVAVARHVQKVELEIGLPEELGVVRADPAGASLGLVTLL
jgi:diguanylate cyclase (GGDEF)-like protein